MSFFGLGPAPTEFVAKAKPPAIKEIHDKLKQNAQKMQPPQKIKRKQKSTIEVIEVQRKGSGRSVFASINGSEARWWQASELRKFSSEIDKKETEQNASLAKTGPSQLQSWT